MNEPERLDLIERYAAGYGILRTAYDRIADEAKKWRPAEGKWSAHEVVCHCADSEANAALRIRYLLAEDAPVIVGYDQDRWCRLLDYANHPIELAFDAVRAVRAHTLPLLRGVSADGWMRAGTHTERGAYSAEDWLRTYAEHLEVHARQIDRIAAAWSERRGMSVATER